MLLSLQLALAVAKKSIYKMNSCFFKDLEEKAKVAEI